MSDNQEQNPAEAEAEAILEAAYGEARAEQCAEGEDCPIHFRVDSEVFYNDAEYARLINYVGDYAVITEDNHEWDNPFVFVKLVLGVTKTVPPCFETTILHVGSGTIGDLSEKSVEERRAAIRYAQTHDEWDKVEYTHLAVLSMLEAGLIDVSKPLRG